MWVEWPFNDVFLLEYVIMKKLTIFYDEYELAWQDQTAVKWVPK